MNECRTYWNYHSDGILLADYCILLLLFVNIRKFIRDQLKSCCCRLFFVLVSCVPCLCSNTRSAICSMSLTFIFELSLAFIVTGNGDTDNLVALTYGNAIPKQRANYQINDKK